jgi:exodeoxyribonuclease VIII
MPILDIKRVQYDALQCLNYSGSKHLLSKSPAHYQLFLNNPSTETKALRIGKLTHACVLQNELFQKYKPKPDADRRTKEGKEIHQFFIDNLKPDEEAVDADEYETALRLGDAMSALLETHGASKRVATEMTVVGIENEHCTIKSSIDLVAEDGDGKVWLYDLKSCEEGGASPKEFLKTAYQYMYHLQAVTYMRTFEKYTKVKPMGFRFIVVEKGSYIGACYELGPQILADGFIKLETAIKLYTECTKTGVWPGYTDGTTIQTLDWEKKTTSTPITFA